MSPSAAAILDILDRSAEAFVFPMLDNGYVYPAAARMTLFRAPADWAIVIETFGFSPRAGVPDLVVTTIGSAVRHDPIGVDDARSGDQDAPDPNWTSRYFHPIDGMPALREDDQESIADHASGFRLRGRWFPMPDSARYDAAGITRETPDALFLYEWARVIAADHRADVMATEQERVAALPSGMTALMTLDDWHHPDLAGSQRPSDIPDFVAFASVLERGDASGYVAGAGNTHWANWPDGGSL